VKKPWNNETMFLHFLELVTDDDGNMMWVVLNFGRGGAKTRFSCGG
jgi:hypothetical protein